MGVIGLALLTALLSSCLTWALAYLLYRKHLEDRLEQLRDELAEEVEERVRRGAVAAGEELLPEFRREVSDGFRDALRGVAGGDVARNVAKTSAEIVGGGLDTLFGQRKRSRFTPW